MCLLLDAFATNEGYKAFITADLATGNFVEISSEFTTPYKFRHGTVIQITMKEYNTLQETYRNV